MTENLVKHLKLQVEGYQNLVKSYKDYICDLEEEKKRLIDENRRLKSKLW